MADRTELYLLRHAHAGDPGAWSGDDDLRPLSDKGQAQAERLGALFASTGFQPDRVITSPKVRAADTARIVARALDVAVAEDDRLADNVTLAALEAVLADAGNPARLLLVGHDPDFSELVGELSGATIPMRKGALARIDVRRPLRPRSGQLRWLIPPDALERR